MTGTGTPPQPLHGPTPHDPAGQTFEAACERFVDLLDRRVTAAGRGDDTDRMAVAPSATFWLGRLASEAEVANSGLGDRAERLEPCAIGIRVRPTGPAPWTVQVTARARAWQQDPKDTGPDPDRRWRRSPPVEVSTTITVPAGERTVTAATDQFTAAFTAAGAAGLTATIRVDVEDWFGEPELVVQLVNTNPADPPQPVDNHLYETALDLTGLPTRPFQLEALPDSFRYDRDVPAYGVNVGVREVPGGFTTTDTVQAQTRRPQYWNSPHAQPDLSFAALASDPDPPLTALVDALADYHQQHWSDAALTRRVTDGNWADGLRGEAATAAVAAETEVTRLRRGVDLLRDDPVLRRAFQLMNQAIELSAHGRYTGWRPFQVGFLLGAVAFLVDPEHEARVVDTVWFATGGGKTETYLGLLVTAALHDRLTGKTSGVTAWSRFPLRLLSLQQTQRFADALAGAEQVRRRERIPGAPFSLGFLVGRGGTPNKVLPERKGEDPDPDSPGMPDGPSAPNKYQVLLRCPFCHGTDVDMAFDRRHWRLAHQCHNETCPWPGEYLPMFVVDQELYRFLPTVVLGTLDKAAGIAMQAAMRGLVGPPLGICSEPGHGYTYAPRGDKKATGCLVPGCTGTRGALPMPRDRYAPTLRLQDELHLLRDSLGAVDSHYESLLDHLQGELGGPPAKVIASSATLTGHDRQVDVLYRRVGRVFPLPGPTADESFWTRRGPEPLRRFVAVAPRGVTLDHVSDRTLDVLQHTVRDLWEHPDQTCAEAGVDPRHADQLLSYYGTDVVYGNTLYDVEAATRSMDNNSSNTGVNSIQLTGQTDFDDVRTYLERLEHPEPDFADRIHVVAASSMLSHGVDVARLNTMVMLGLPLSTAEFIQTTARVGRSHPGLVYVLHKIGRERDAATFRQFGSYISHGDRFVDPIPITRRSRRVLRLTMPAIVAARRHDLMEPQAPGQRLTTLNKLRDYASTVGLAPAEQAGVIAEMLGFTGADDDLLRTEIRDWLGIWFRDLDDPTSTKPPWELGPNGPMTSLRDVETAVPIHD